MRQHFLVRWSFGAFALHLFFKTAVRQNLIRLRLFAAATDFQIAQDERSLAVLFEENKSVRREEASRIQHVGIGLARRDDEVRFR